MKKVLSIALALAMIATLFTGTIVMPASAESVEAGKAFLMESYDSTKDVSGKNGWYNDTENYAEGDGSVRIDMAEAFLWGSEYGGDDSIIIDADELKQLDYNVKYYIRASIKGTSDFNGCVYVYTVSHFNDGGSLTEQKRIYTYWGEQLLLNSSGSGWSGAATEWTTYRSTTTIAPVGHKMELKICVRGAGAGSLWIDKIELVPETASSECGYITLKGYDETLGKTIYTAYANEGYAVSDITAVDAGGSEVEVTEEKYISKSEIEFSTANPGSVMGDKGFLGLKFAVNSAPAQSPSESVPVYSFTEVNVPSGTGNTWDADKGAFKFDIDDKYAAAPTAGEYALDVSMSLPAGTMDAATTYALRINYEATAGFTANMYAFVYADGSNIRRGPWNGEARITNGHSDISGATALKSVDYLSVYGYNMSLTLALRITNANAAAMVASGNEDNALWIKSIELVPTENNSGAHGYVLVTGYDSDNGRPIFTAYPDEGYEVASAYATVYNSFDKVEVAATVTDETSDSCSFYIDCAKPDASGNYSVYMKDSNGKFIRASFVESDVVPMLSPDESYVIYDFDTADQLADWNGAYIEDDPDYVYGGEGGSLAFEGTVSKEYDIYLNAADIAHFDANNRYFVELEFSAEPTASALIYANTFYDFGYATGQISRTHYENHMDIVGAGPDKNYISGDDSYATYRSTSSIPVVGNKVRLQLCIRNTGVGVIQIDNIRFVPEYDNTGNHGYVQSSYNAETNTVDFIATAEECYVAKSLTKTNAACGISAELCAKLGNIGNYDQYTWTYAAKEKLSATQTLFSLTYDDMFPESGFIVCDNGDKTFIRVGFVDASTLTGDVNGDIEVNILDLVRLKNYIAGNAVTVAEAKADLNGDGEITASDIVELRKVLLGI